MPKSPRPPGRPSTKLSRKEAAQRLGMTVTNLRNLERRGEITGLVDTRGRRVFSAAAIESLAIFRAARRKGGEGAPLPLRPPNPAVTPDPIEDSSASSRPIGPHRKAAIESAGDRAFSTEEGVRQGLVFKLLAQGLTCIQVTMHTGIDIRKVREIHGLWMEEQPEPTSTESSQAPTDGT